MDDKDIANLDMNKAGDTVRMMLAKHLYGEISKPNPFLEHLMANLPPDTRTPWQKFACRLSGKWDDFRIWLSKKIYDWSGYEE